jgi:hypothetical protein
MPVMIRKSVNYGCKCFEEEEAAAMNRKNRLPCTKKCTMPDCSFVRVLLFDMPG